MSATQVTKAYTETSVAYFLEYDSIDCPDSGYSFPCDEYGRITEEANATSLAYVSRNAAAYHSPYISKRVNRYRVPAAYRCACGEEFNQPYDIFDCVCGRCYNSFGQELDPHAAHCRICGELGGDCCGERF